MVSCLFEEGDKFLFFYVTKINFRVAGRETSFSNMTDKQSNQWASLYTACGRGIEVSMRIVQDVGGL